MNEWIDEFWKQNAEAIKEFWKQNAEITRQANAFPPPDRTGKIMKIIGQHRLSDVFQDPCFNDVLEANHINRIYDCRYQEAAYFLAIDMYLLGMIVGKRKERQKRKKKTATT